MILGVVVNLSKNNADVALRAVLKKLEELHATYYVEENTVTSLRLTAPSLPQEKLYLTCDVFIAIGGDGTIIHAAKKAAVHHKPVLGINAGRVGYMACLEVSELDLLSRLLDGDYVVETRMMLKATTSSRPEQSFYCLNDVEISKTDSSNVLDLTVENGADRFMSFRADGVVVATPTGSTAYAMSAGGPVTDPTLACMVLVPICSMSMYSRGFVLSPDSDLRVRCQVDGTNACLVKFDGENTILLESDETVSICRSDEMYTQLIKIKGDSFYSILKNKLTDL